MINLEKMNYFISDTSLVNNYVKIGDNSKIWNFCNIYGEDNHLVKIGRNTQIGSFCEIKPGVTIGNFCRFQSYVFVPEEIIIGDDVFIGPRVTFTNDKYPLSNDFYQRNWVAEKTTIEKRVSIGASSVIGPGRIIGEGSLIGIGSIITKDIEPFSIIVGNNKKIGDIRDDKFREKIKQYITI